MWLDIFQDFLAVRLIHNTNHPSKLYKHACFWTAKCLLVSPEDFSVFCILGVHTFASFLPLVHQLWECHSRAVSFNIRKMPFSIPAVGSLSSAWFALQSQTLACLNGKRRGKGGKLITLHCLKRKSIDCLIQDTFWHGWALHGVLSDSSPSSVRPSVHCMSLKPLLVWTLEFSPPQGRQQRGRLKHS